METPERTVEDLANEIIANLEGSYDLVYVDYRDQLTDKQVAMLVRKDLDGFWESTAEFEADSQYDSIKEIIEAAGREVIDLWEGEDDEDYSHLMAELEGGDEWERIREEIQDRDTSRWADQLASQTGTVLLRIPVPQLDEDHAIFHEEIGAADLMAKLDIPSTDTHRQVIEDLLANADPEYSLLMGYWVVGISVADIYRLEGYSEYVAISNPHLFLGNPFAGSGYLSEDSLSMEIRVKREDLRTDEDAFGYSIEKIYGGVNPSQFEGSIRSCAY